MGNNKYLNTEGAPSLMQIKSIFTAKRSLKFVLLCLILTTLLCCFYLLHQLVELQLTVNEVLSSAATEENHHRHEITVEDHNRVTLHPSSDKHYPNYYEDDLHPNWIFNISRTYDPKYLHRWSQPIRKPKSNRDRWTRGESGSAFTPMNDMENEEIQKSIEEHNYNLYASEHISLRRTLPDYRFDECRRLTYPDRLPNVSIVIVFHNEPWSLILRTIWSIIDRTPAELLHEIILVDDASTWDFLKRPLDDYIELLPSVSIKIIRSQQREGLIRARLIGAAAATGSILVFFDAHMECTDGWLQPLVARIANDRSVVTVPIIDMINIDHMGYNAFDEVSVTMIRSNMIFIWTPIPERELNRTNHDRTAPLRTPSHVGCAFAIDREFFYEIGSYDTGMDIWGSENAELAFRVWMCGGSLELLPCSRVGHLYRQSTYTYNGDQMAITSRNYVRLVEVWMDEYKRFFYASQRHAQNVSPGDLSARKNLRKQLKCKSFRWYLENIYPESSWLKEYYHLGEIYSVATNMCLDLGRMYLGAKLLIWPCHEGENQFFAMAKSGPIVFVEEYCVGVNNEYDVIVVECSDSDSKQLWTYDNQRQWIVHRQSNWCLQTVGESFVILAECNEADEQMQWTLKSTLPSMNCSK